MAIKFNCDCGQTITARDEYAGRKVQCVGCKKVHVVPGDKKPAVQTALRPPARPPAPLPPPHVPEPAETLVAPPAPQPESAAPSFEAPLTATPDFEDELFAPSEPSRPAAVAIAPRTDVLRFRCACGAEFHAHPEFAGQPTRCSHCGEILFIPTRQTAGRTDGRPVKVGFDRDDRYRPYRGGESGLKGLLIAVLILVLMGGGAYAYWEFYLKNLKPAGPSPDQLAGPGDGLREGGRMPPGMGGGGGRPGGGMPGGGMPGGGMPGGGRPGGGRPGGGGGIPGGGIPGGGRPGGGRPGGGEERPPQQQEKPVIVHDGENAQVSAFDLVPADAVGFLSSRVADINNHPDVRKMLGNLSKEQLAALEASEKQLGLKQADIERVIGVFPDTNGTNAYAILETSKPIEREKFLTAARVAKPVYHEDGGVKRAYYPTQAGPAIHFVNDRLVVLAQTPGMENFLSQKQLKKTGPLEGDLKRTAGKDLVVGAVVPPPGLLEGAAKLFDPAAAFKPLLGFKKVSTFSKETEATKSTFEIEYGDAAAAEAARKAVEDLKAEAGKHLKALTLPKEAAECLNDILDNTRVTTAQATVRVEITGNVEKLTAMLGALLPAASKVRESAGRVQAENNLKQLALAMIAYADAHNGQMPPQAIRDQAGKPLYSWRVALLPYLGENTLYQKLKLDEAWDGAHNAPLLENMPKVFQIPFTAGGRSSNTVFEVFAGEGTPFPTNKQVVRYPQGFSNGTSNTLLIVEAKMPVNWASPGDIYYSPDIKVTIRLGDRSGPGTLAAFADGTVRLLPKTITEEQVQAYINPAGGKKAPKP